MRDGNRSTPRYEPPQPATHARRLVVRERDRSALVSRMVHPNRSLVAGVGGFAPTFKGTSANRSSAANQASMSDTIGQQIRLPRVLRVRDPQAVETANGRRTAWPRPCTKILATRHRTSDIHRDGTRHVTQHTPPFFLLLCGVIGPARRVHDLPGIYAYFIFPSSSRHSRKDCAAVLIAQELHACTFHASARFCCLAKRQDRRPTIIRQRLAPFTAGDLQGFRRTRSGATARAVSEYARVALLQLVLEPGQPNPSPIFSNRSPIC
jgi:hypothetical protein